MTVHDALAEAVAALRAAGIPDSRLEAELLLADLLGWERGSLVARDDHALSPGQLATYRQRVARRARGEPVAYILGYRWFYGVKLHVTPAVLIPRPETETLVELALADLRCRPGERLQVADVGTGCAAIAVAIARHEPRARVWATDISARALQVAQANVRDHGLLNRVHLFQADLLTPLRGPFDLIVANLPYVGVDEKDVLPPEVREFEPPEALWAGPDGLDVIERLLLQAPARLRAHGTVLLEIGYQQGKAVMALARGVFPAATLTLHRDLAGNERVIRVQR